MSLRTVNLFFGLILIFFIFTRELLRFTKNPHMPEKSVSNEQSKYHFFSNDDPQKRGSCTWNSKSNEKNRGTLKKRWPDVIGLGFAKVRILFSW